MAVTYPRARGLFKERFKVHRKARTSDRQGGSIIGTSVIGTVSGRLTDLGAARRFFADKLDHAREASLWIIDHLGITADDRFEDSRGKLWDVVTLAHRGDLKELVVREAVS